MHFPFAMTLPEEISSDQASVDDLLPLDPDTEEKNLLRKLDKRILPITCLLYLFACELLALVVLFYRNMPQTLTDQTWEMPVYWVYPRMSLVAILQVYCLIG